MVQIPACSGAFNFITSSADEVCSGTFHCSQQGLLVSALKLSLTIYFLTWKQQLTNNGYG